MANLDAVISRLKKQRDKLNQAITALESVSGSGEKRRSGKRTMSAAGRARIAAAQRKRWAMVRAKRKKR